MAYPSLFSLGCLFKRSSGRVAPKSFHYTLGYWCLDPTWQPFRLWSLVLAVAGLCGGDQTSTYWVEVSLIPAGVQLTPAYSHLGGAVADTGEHICLLQASPEPHSVATKSP